MPRQVTTPRKRVRVPEPLVPPGATWIFQPTVEAHSDGRIAGYFPRTLAYMLQSQGYTDAPFYHGTRVPLSNYGYAWIVHVTLYEKPSRDGVRRARRIHHATAPRATFEGGMRDAARQAMAVLRTEIESFNNSQFEHFPSRESGSVKFNVRPTSPDDSPRLREQVRLTTAMNDELNAALDELEKMHQRKAEDEALIKDLKKALAEVEGPVESEKTEAEVAVVPSSPTRPELLQPPPAPPSSPSESEASSPSEN